MKNGGMKYSMSFILFEFRPMITTVYLFSLKLIISNPLILCMLQLDYKIKQKVLANLKNFGLYLLFCLQLTLVYTYLQLILKNTFCCTTVVVSYQNRVCHATYGMTTIPENCYAGCI